MCSRRQSFLDTALDAPHPKEAHPITLSFAAVPPRAFLRKNQQNGGRGVGHVQGELPAPEEGTRRQDAF